VKTDVNKQTRKQQDENPELNALLNNFRNLRSAVERAELNSTDWRLFFELLILVFGSLLDGDEGPLETLQLTIQLLGLDESSADSEMSFNCFEVGSVPQLVH
jgi:hypothetical protein